MQRLGGRYDMKKNCLIVLNPREIKKCLDTIRSLHIDKLFMRGWSEPELCRPINDFISNTSYDNYLILSDDVMVDNAALQLVVELLEDYEAATGYCLVSQEDSYVNITRSPLRMRGKIISNFSTIPYCPLLEDYDFYYKEEVEKFQNPIFVTWFGGWCLTGFSRRLWLENPFRVMPSEKQSDYATCIVYGKKIMCHKDAYVEHLKQGLHKECREGFLVGEINPEMIYETNGRSTYLETRGYYQTRIRLV